jgi:hypothetical protein
VASLDGFTLSLTCDPSTFTVTAITLSRSDGHAPNAGWDGSAGQVAFDGENFGGGGTSVNMATGAAASSNEGGLTFEATAQGTGIFITGQFHWKALDEGGFLASCLILGVLTSAD